jgi:hypothetical protein
MLFIFIGIYCRSGEKYSILTNKQKPNPPLMDLFLVESTRTIYMLVGFDSRSDTNLRITIKSSILEQRTVNSKVQTIVN